MEFIQELESIEETCATQNGGSSVWKEINLLVKMFEILSCVFKLFLFKWFGCKYFDNNICGLMRIEDDGVPGPDVGGSPFIYAYEHAR